MSTQTVVTTLMPHSGVRIEITEYNPVTGNATRKLSSLNFDRTTLEQFSTPIVIKMNVVGVQKIDNIKIGIIKSSIQIQSSGETNSDGSKTCGNIGIEHSTELIEKSALTSFFPGLNSLGSPASSQNVLISNSSDTNSEYIYLNLQMPETSGRGYIGFKWFFDFV